MNLGMSSHSVGSCLRNLVKLLVILMSGASSLGFADVAYVPYPVKETGTITDEPHIRIYGEIKKGDEEKIKSIIDNHKDQMIKRFKLIIVVLDSQGGDIGTAMRIGRRLREANAWTIVDMNDKCSSSCVLLLASGVRRDVFSGAQIGLHRPRFDHEYFAGLTRSESESLYNSLIDGINSYFLSMNVSERILSDMLKAPSWEIDYRNREYAEEVGLIGFDPSFHEWRRAQEIEKHGEEYIQRRDLWVECYNSGTAHATCDLLYKQQ